MIAKLLGRDDQGLGRFVPIRLAGVLAGHERERDGPVLTGQVDVGLEDVHGLGARGGIGAGRRGAAHEHGRLGGEGDLEPGLPSNGHGLVANGFVVDPAHLDHVEIRVLGQAGHGFDDRPVPPQARGPSHPVDDSQSAIVTNRFLHGWLSRAVALRLIKGEYSSLGGGN